MASNPSPPGAAWHSELAEQDAKAHERMAEVDRATEVDLLRRRLDGLTSEVTVLRAAVDRRARLLHEQSLALAERDTRLRVMEVALRDRAAWIAAPISALRRARSFIGGLVRRGLRQR